MRRSEVCRPGGPADQTVPVAIGAGDEPVGEHREQEQHEERREPLHERPDPQRRVDGGCRVGRGAERTTAHETLFHQGNQCTAYAVRFCIHCESLC